jgi:ankyrin
VNETVPAPPVVPTAVPKPSTIEDRAAARPAPTNNAPEVINPVLFPIHDAAEIGDLDQVKALLKAWPELLEAPDEKGVTPLHVAAANGRKLVAEALLVRRANVALKTKLGWTPLHFAAGKGDPATVALLLAYGAPVNEKSPMDITPLHLAVREGQIEAARLLLDQKADVNQHDKGTGATPLHLAAENGSLPLVELLLAHGAEVNALNTAGETPLTLASTAGRSGVVELLRQRGAQDPKNKPLSPQEQNLVTFYEGVDRAFRNGSASE